MADDTDQTLKSQLKYSVSEYGSRFLKKPRCIPMKCNYLQKMVTNLIFQGMAIASHLFSIFQAILLLCEI